MIKKPERCDIVQMKEIWRLCFGDSDEVIDCYFNTCFNFDDCYISKNADTVEGMIFLIPCFLNKNGEKSKCRYMYGVSTHPSFQGRGVMSLLINEAAEMEKNEGTKAIFCIPASESLFEFYARFGFKNAIYSSESILRRTEAENNSQKCDYKANEDIISLNEVRRTLLRKNTFVDFPEKYLSLANGFGYSYIYSDDFYAFYTIEDDLVRVADCGYVSGEENKLNYALLKETNGNQFLFSTPNLAYNCKLKGVALALDNSVFSQDDKIYLGIKME